MKSFFRSLILVLGVFLFSACASTTQSGVVGADRSQVLLVSSAAMDAQAKSSYAEVLADAKAKNILNTSPATTKRVQNIANRLIAKSVAFREDALSWDWQVNVITDSTVNAWCMPGGKIVVYTGIIESLNLTDGELAAVMGHEISHALREHSREQASKEALTSLGMVAVAVATGMDDTMYAVLQYGAQLGLTLPFSRKCETEADNMGTELMARAGYDPHEAVNVWKKMSAMSGSSVPQILSTHPSNETRIQNLSVISEKVYPLYQATL